MRSTLELLSFVAVALIVHLAFFLKLDAGALGAAGNQGEASVQIQAVSAEITDILAAVDTPPEMPELQMAALDARPPVSIQPTGVVSALPTPSAPQTASNLPELPNLSAGDVTVPVFVAPPQPQVRSPELAGDLPLVAEPVSTIEAFPSSVQSPEMPELSNQARVEPPVMMAPKAPVELPSPPAELPSLPHQELQLALVGPTPKPSPELEEPFTEEMKQPEPLTAPIPAQTLLAPPPSPRPTAIPQPRVQPPDVLTPAPTTEKYSEPAQPTNRNVQSQAAQTAAGSGDGATAGQNNLSADPGLSSARVQSLKATWGNRIRARIERRKPRVRGGYTGMATVRVVVAGDGRLADLSLVSSSGEDILDAAALDAVRRTGGFPKAPKDLGEGPHSFRLAIRFD